MVSKKDVLKQTYSQVVPKAQKCGQLSNSVISDMLTLPKYSLMFKISAITETKSKATSFWWDKFCDNLKQTNKPLYDKLISRLGSSLTPDYIDEHLKVANTLMRTYTWGADLNISGIITFTVEAEYKINTSDNMLDEYWHLNDYLIVSN